VYIRSVVEFSCIAAGAIGGEERSGRGSPRLDQRHVARGIFR
jgi:hypothetical protein